MANKPVVILNGSGGVGKDTFADLCGDYVSMKHISTVTVIKQVASLIGWNWTYTEKDRKFLSDLKLLSVDYSDHPFEFIKGEIELFKSSDYDILFVDVREPEEIQRFVEVFGCITVLITNNRVAPITSNMADANVLNFTYDYVIENNGTIADLSNKAKEFVKSILYIRWDGRKM